MVIALLVPIPIKVGGQNQAAFPVVEEKGYVVGILTDSDIFRAVIYEAEQTVVAP